VVEALLRVQTVGVGGALGCLAQELDADIGVFALRVCLALRDNAGFTQADLALPAVGVVHTPDIKDALPFDAGLVGEAIGVGLAPLVELAEVVHTDLAVKAVGVYVAARIKDA
jgi:hypothetical protein